MLAGPQNELGEKQTGSARLDLSLSSFENHLILFGQRLQPRKEILRVAAFRQSSDTHGKQTTKSQGEGAALPLGQALKSGLPNNGHGLRRAALPGDTPPLFKTCLAPSRVRHVADLQEQAPAASVLKSALILGRQPTDHRTGEKGWKSASGI